MMSTHLLWLLATGISSTPDVLVMQLELSRQGLVYDSDA